MFVHKHTGVDDENNSTNYPQLDCFVALQQVVVCCFCYDYFFQQQQHVVLELGLK